MCLHLVDHLKFLSLAVVLKVCVSLCTDTLPSLASALPSNVGGASMVMGGLGMVGKSPGLATANNNGVGGDNNREQVLYEFYLGCPSNYVPPGNWHRVYLFTTCPLE